MSTIEAKVLQKILKRLSLVGGHLAIPQHGLVLFNSRENFVLAMDSELSLRIPCELGDDVDNFAVSAKLLSSVVSRLSGELKLSVSAGQVDEPDALTISQRKTNIQLPLADSNVFPNLQNPDTQIACCPFSVLAFVLQFPIRCTSGKDFDPTPILLESNGEAVIAAGTNGNRLGVVSSKEKLPAFSLLISSRAAAALDSLSGEKTVPVGENDANYFFGTENFSLVVRKTSAKFPDYEKFIPKDFPTEAVIEKPDAALAALNRVGGILDEKQTVTVHFADGAARISTSHDSGAKTEDSFAVQTKGSPITVKLNHGYLTEFLEQAIGPVKIGLRDSRSPVVMESQNSRYLLATIA